MRILCDACWPVWAVTLFLFMRWWGFFCGDVREWKWHPPSWNGLGKVLMAHGSPPFSSHHPTAQFGPYVWISLADSRPVSRHSISTSSNLFCIVRSYLSSLNSSWLIAVSCSESVDASFIHATDIEHLLCWAQYCTKLCTYSVVQSAIGPQGGLSVFVSLSWNISRPPLLGFDMSFWLYVNYETFPSTSLVYSPWPAHSGTFLSPLLGHGLALAKAHLSFETNTSLPSVSRTSEATWVLRIPAPKPQRCFLGTTYFLPEGRLQTGQLLCLLWPLLPSLTVHETPESCDHMDLLSVSKALLWAVKIAGGWGTAQVLAGASRAFYTIKKSAIISNVWT